MALLEVDRLSIQFGNVRAVQDVSFAVDEGIVYSVIGPNGAGKTTLFNLITGVYRPTAGAVRLDGREIQGRTPYELARRGMARTFQNLQVWMNMSALENVMVGAHLHLDGGLAPDGTRILSAESAEAMAQHHADLPDKYILGDSWGLGWIRFGWNGSRLIGHDGNTLGQAGFLRILPEQGVELGVSGAGGSHQCLRVAIGIVRVDPGTR